MPNCGVKVNHYGSSNGECRSQVNYAQYGIKHCRRHWDDDDREVYRKVLEERINGRKVISRKVTEEPVNNRKIDRSIRLIQEENRLIFSVIENGVEVEGSKVDILMSELPENWRSFPVEKMYGFIKELNNKA